MPTHRRIHRPLEQDCSRRPNHQGIPATASPAGDPPLERNPSSVPPRFSREIIPSVGFSHSLGQKRKPSVPYSSSALPLRAGATAVRTDLGNGPLTSDISPSSGKTVRPAFSQGFPIIRVDWNRLTHDSVWVVRNPGEFAGKDELAAAGRRRKSTASAARKKLARSCRRECVTYDRGFRTRRPSSAHHHDRRDHDLRLDRCKGNSQRRWSCRFPCTSEFSEKRTEAGCHR